MVYTLETLPVQQPTNTPLKQSARDNLGAEIDVVLTERDVKRPEQELNPQPSDGEHSHFKTNIQPDGDWTLAFTCVFRV